MATKALFAPSVEAVTVAWVKPCHDRVLFIADPDRYRKRLASKKVVV
jgi:hypothetical protein